MHPAHYLTKLVQPAMWHGSSNSAACPQVAPNVPHPAGAPTRLLAPGPQVATPAATTHSGKTSSCCCQALVPFELHRWVRTADCGEGEGGRAARVWLVACSRVGSKARPGGPEATELCVTALHQIRNCTDTKLWYMKRPRLTTRFRNGAGTGSSTELLQRAVHSNTCFGGVPHGTQHPHVTPMRHLGKSQNTHQGILHLQQHPPRGAHLLYASTATMWSASIPMQLQASRPARCDAAQLQHSCLPLLDAG